MNAADAAGRKVPATPDGPALAEVLSRHGVRYVAIGGFVAQTVLPGYETRDIDFHPRYRPGQFGLLFLGSF